MGVKIAEKGRMLPGLRDRTARHDKIGVLLGRWFGRAYSLPLGAKQRLALALLIIFVADLVDEFGKPDGPVGLGIPLQVFAPLMPAQSMMGKSLFHQPGHMLSALRHGSVAALGHQSGVALLLTGNHMVDDHRATGRQCLLNDGTTRLGDQQVAFHQQPRHDVGPSQQGHTVRMMPGGLGQLRLELRVPTHRDGQMDPGQLQQFLHGPSSLFLVVVHHQQQSSNRRRLG